MGVSGQKHEASLVGSGSPQIEELEQPADGSSNLPRATKQFGRDAGFRSTRLRVQKFFSSDLQNLRRRSPVIRPPMCAKKPPPAKRSKPAMNMIRITPRKPVAAPIMP